MDSEVLVELARCALVDDLDDLGAIFGARPITDEVDHVRAGGHGLVAGNDELRDQGAERDLPPGVHVRHLPEDEVRPSDLDVVALVLQAFEISVTTYQLP